jgi:hypothetical protein
VLVLAAGCGRKDTAGAAPPTNAASGNPLTAPADYLGAAAKAKTASERTIDTVSLNQAVQLFYAGEGRFPNELKELVAEGYLPRLPDAPPGMQIVYDPVRGQVKVVAR